MFGVHILKKNSIPENLDLFITDFKTKLNAIQIFTHGPRSYKKNNLDYKKIKDTISKNKINLYIHSSYFSSVWNNNIQSFITTIHQFKLGVILNARGIVLHIPKKNKDDIIAGVKKLLLELKRKKIDILILLEMKALKQDPELSYESPKKLDLLIERMKKEGIKKNRVGFVIDTAHIYSGKQKIKSYSQAKKYMNDFKNKDWVKLIHLNGNQYNNDEKSRDKHAIPFDKTDQIWGNINYKNSGCRYFVDYCKKNNLDFILEIKNEHTINNLKKFVELL